MRHVSPVLDVPPSLVRLRLCLCTYFTDHNMRDGLMQDPIDLGPCEGNTGTCSETEPLKC